MRSPRDFSSLPARVRQPGREFLIKLTAHDECSAADRRPFCAKVNILLIGHACARERRFRLKPIRRLNSLKLTWATYKLIFITCNHTLSDRALTLTLSHRIVHSLCQAMILTLIFPSNCRSHGWITALLCNSSGFGGANDCSSTHHMVTVWLP